MFMLVFILNTAQAATQMLYVEYLHLYERKIPRLTRVFVLPSSIRHIFADDVTNNVSEFVAQARLHNKYWTCLTHELKLYPKPYQSLMIPAMNTFDIYSFRLLQNKV